MRWYIQVYYKFSGTKYNKGREETPRVAERAKLRVTRTSMAKLRKIEEDEAI